MRRPIRFWVPKWDSSITGIEFVSFPATLDFWHEKSKQFDEMFKMLLHAGYRSHANDRCGMHVNISDVTFEGQRHLCDFLTFLAENRKWSVRMAQRTFESPNRWANLYDIGDAHARETVSRRAFLPYYLGDTCHTSVVNIPHREHRFEFRLPRGTLRLDRFYKNLEWTTAMIEYFRKAGRISLPSLSWHGSKITHWNIQISFPL